MNHHRIFSDFSALEPDWPQLRPQTGQIVFTNGCFDILHAGHVTYLAEARQLGDFLVLGLNSDASVRRLKGMRRPIHCFDDRALVLSHLRSVDLVVGFDEDTPYELIRKLCPDILVKGGDWRPDQIVGSELVLARGGQVRALSFRAGNSTTGTVETILERYSQ